MAFLIHTESGMDALPQRRFAYPLRSRAGAGPRARWRAPRWTFAALVLLFGCPALTAEPAAREQDVKATFLFHFCSFVQWPESAFAHATAPIVIGVLGPDPLGSILDDLVRNETAQGRRIEVRRFHRVEDAHAAHVLYISGSDDIRLDLVLAALKGRPILTVGDSRTLSFAPRGGMIAFANDRGRLRLRINVDAAQAAGLTLSAKLLRVAEIVRTTP